MGQYDGKGGYGNQALDRALAYVSSGQGSLTDYLKMTYPGMDDQNIQSLAQKWMAADPQLGSYAINNEQANVNTQVSKDLDFLKDLLPQAEIAPQTVVDQRMEDFLYANRAGGKATGALTTGLNIPEGALPSPISTTNPTIDPNTLAQLGYMRGGNSAALPGGASLPTAGEKGVDMPMSKPTMNSVPVNGMNQAGVK